MDKVKVFYFEKFSPIPWKIMRSKRFATREAIASAGGKILEDTAREVDVSQLEDGFWRPE